MREKASESLLKVRFESLTSHLKDEYPTSKYVFSIKGIDCTTIIFDKFHHRRTVCNTPDLGRGRLSTVRKTNT